MCNNTEQLLHPPQRKKIFKLWGSTEPKPVNTGRSQPPKGTSMPAHPKTSHDQMLQLFKTIVKEKQDSEKILLTANKLNSFYKIELDIDISNPTLRNYGFCPGGYFTTRWPGVFTYNDEGKREHRGMIIDVENFKENIGLEHKESGEEQEGEEDDS